MDGKMRPNSLHGSSSVSSSVKIAAGAVVCKDSELLGDITIGSKTVIHPKAKIIAESGPIVIGDCNLIEEQVEIINRSIEGKGETMFIGSNNVFEVGAYSEALKIGDNNVLEAKTYVGRKTVLTSGCVIGSMCKVTSEENLPENTVIFGRNHQRRVQSEKPGQQTLQLDFLIKVLPNYHHIRKHQKNELTRDASLPAPPSSQMRK